MMNRGQSLLAVACYCLLLGFAIESSGAGELAERNSSPCVRPLDRDAQQEQSSTFDACQVGDDVQPVPLGRPTRTSGIVDHRRPMRARTSLRAGDHPLGLGDVVYTFTRIVLP